MRGLLLSQMDPPAELEDEFHEWYDGEHVPGRRRLPGFGAAVRYLAIDPATRFLVCYFIDDLSVLGTDAYARLKHEPSVRTVRMLDAVRDFTRYTCELVTDIGGGPAGSLTLVHAVRAAGDGAEFEAAQSRSCAELDVVWRRTRLYRTFGDCIGEPWTHFALHELDAGGDTDAVPPPPETSDLPGVESDRWWTYRAFRRFGETVA